jgi:hypothetical protein
MQTARTHGLYDDTLIVLAGNQKWMDGRNGFFGMGDHTRPFAARDLIMQVLPISLHLNAISSGESRTMVSNTDFLPSVLEHLNLKHPILDTSKRRITGCSDAAVLRHQRID